MRLDKVDSQEIRFVLSERNVRALLEKLTWDSKRTIVWPGDDGQPKVYISIEPDEEHYANRTVPGVMLRHDGEFY